mgnify:CR=1 FL=1
MMNIPLRRELVATARKMSESGLTGGTSGNVSVRVEGGLLITPSGLPYDDMGIEDLCELSSDGKPRSFGLEPSTEWRIHCDIYRTRPEVKAIVHAHPMFATTLSILTTPPPSRSHPQP